MYNIRELAYPKCQKKCDLTHTFGLTLSVPDLPRAGIEKIKK
jgi:hypothetical protein